MNARLVLHSDSLSSMPPGMELKEDCFPSQPAFPERPQQTSPCASTLSRTHLSQSRPGQKHQAPQRKMLIWKLEMDSSSLDTLSAHSFQWTLLTLELLVCRPVSPATQYAASVFKAASIFCLPLHTYSCDLHIVKATLVFWQFNFQKIIKPKQQSQVA